MERVGIVGVGFEGFRPAITDISTRELMFQAASRAYSDAGIDPRKDVGSFICCTEDLWEGWSIADEMVPDQVGGARRPLFTVAGDGIIGIGHAAMHIRSGVADVVAVEAHSKVADVLDGLEMNAFMARTGIGRDEISLAVQAEKRSALRNGRASYGAKLSIKEISGAEPI